MFEELRQHVGKYYGKYSGQVIANDQDPDNMGNIVVKVPAIFGPDAQVTARPCMPYGHFFIPAVGTMVWIEFEGGHRLSNLGRHLAAARGDAFARCYLAA